MKSILVVCEGNICRSPMAMGLFTAALPKVRVRSAGLNALIGMPADEAAVHLLGMRGIDISSHRAVQINKDLCFDAELVLVMSVSQRKEMEKRYPIVHGRVYRLCEFSNSDVRDPYRQSRSAFEDALKAIDKGVREWARRIEMI